jgi:hypothetical protein
LTKKKTIIGAKSAAHCSVISNFFDEIYFQALPILDSLKAVSRLQEMMLVLMHLLTLMNYLRNVFIPATYISEDGSDLHVEKQWCY